MHRLFDGEFRAASMTRSAPSAKPRTQASNFSLVRRSTALEVTGTVSILNCRKHSAMRARVGSFNPTSAVLAAALRGGGVGTRGATKALSIMKGRLNFLKSIVRSAGGLEQDPKDQHADRKEGQYLARSARKRTLRPNAPSNQGFAGDER